MAMGLPRLVAIAFTLILVSLPLPVSLAGEITSIESVPDLQRLMYVPVDGYPCVRLLNLSGEIGCSNPGLNKVVAPIIKLKDVKDLVQPHTVLVSVDEMEDFFTRVSNHLSFASKIGGVLVESGSKFQQNLKGFSPDKRFPQAQFSPYENFEYKWNSAASSIMWKKYNFPVYLLSESGISAVQEIISKKKMKHKTYTTEGESISTFSFWYVPAYSTRLKYDDGAWTVLPPNSSDSMEMVDPVWTESNWDTIRVHVYTTQHSAYDNAVLVAGITVTTLAYIGILGAKSFIAKALKQD